MMTKCLDLHYSCSEAEVQLDSGGDCPLNIHLFVAGYLHSMILALQQDTGLGLTRHYVENKTSRTKWKNEG